VIGRSIHALARPFAVPIPRRRVVARDGDAHNASRFGATSTGVTTRSPFVDGFVTI
jgi:hypothetical protein